MAEPNTRTRRSKALRSFNPRTGETLGYVPATAPDEVAGMVATGRKVAPEWGAIDPASRARLIKQVRHRIYDRLDDIVETIAQETGKPRAEAVEADILPAILTLLYLERVAPRALRPEARGGAVGAMLGLSTKVHWRPFGVVGAITPWNYPFGLGMVAILPALFAGNALVLKPSEVTPGVGERIREVLEPLPAGVATVIQGAGPVGAALVDAPCDKICFIGSPATGRKIAATAAKHLTPVVMELGGKDAAIVCSDADLDLAASGILWGSFVNAGQTCCAIERVYVVDSVADEFKALLLEKHGRLRFGGEDADVGSVTNKAQYRTVAGQLSDATDKGAVVLAGGEDAPNRNGSLWFSPTVVEGVTEEMDLMSEETFGPIVPIIRVADESDAITRANDDAPNLTASVWTKDRDKGEIIASRLKAGAVLINAHAESYGAPWAPWGGVGGSGYGRINGIYGLREFVQPVAVGRNTIPMLKRLWWYPYDDATEKALTGSARVLSARSIGEKVRELPDVLANARAALRNKL
ncbi:MAG TPA: aldehyde dehydrogenase family protein [Actinomycetota bacterium]|nr:aldehyde dehydrogenase family protein [Actinomycetota bacterium]